MRVVVVAGSVWEFRLLLLVVLAAVALAAKTAMEAPAPTV
jgi:hypothetical protein